MHKWRARAPTAPGLLTIAPPSPPFSLGWSLFVSVRWHNAICCSSFFFFFLLFSFFIFFFFFIGRCRASRMRWMIHLTASAKTTLISTSMLELSCWFVFSSSFLSPPPPCQSGAVAAGGAVPDRRPPAKLAREPAHAAPTRKHHAPRPGHSPPRIPAPAH